MADLSCLDGGTLVGGDGRIPTAAHDARRVRGLVWGCNHLVCRACGQPVVQRAGVRVASPAVDRAVLHSGAVAWDDAVAKGWLDADPEWRTYLCQCRSWSDDRTRGLEVGEDWDSFVGEFSPPWRCAGHARVTEVDGVVLDTQPGWVEEALHNDRKIEWLNGSPGAWIARAISLLEGENLSRIGTTLGRALTAPAAEVRSRAADVFRLLPELPGAEWAARALHQWPDGYRAVLDPLRAPRTLDMPLQEVVGYRLVAKLAGPDEVQHAAALLEDGYVPSDWLARGLALEAPTALARGVAAALSTTPTATMVARLVAAGARADHPTLSDALVDAAAKGLGPEAAWVAATQGLARGTLRERLSEVGPK